MTKKHDIIWFESVDSTNNEAKRSISDLDNLSVVSALSQTEGRGQRGNRWQSESGSNLLFSIVLKFGNKDRNTLESLQAYDQFMISEMAALAIVDLLSSFGIDAKIKWPNDIYVNDRKICGILIENALKGELLTYSIIGIGLNVNQMQFDPELPNPTSMRAVSGERYDLTSVLEGYMDIFTGYIERYCNIKRSNSLRRLYLAQMWRKDEENDYVDCSTSDPVPFKGVIRGVSDIGHLLVETNEGELKEFAFKEISYII